MTACRPSSRPVRSATARRCTWPCRRFIAAARPTCTAAGRPAPTGCCRVLPQAALARVILLSDGNANVGEITDTAGIAALCAQAAERGVTTSTYGLGRDFNEELMVEMAKRGGGNHYYGDTAADLFEPFAEEFDFISALCARHVRLSLAAAPGVNVRLLNDYPVEGDAGIPVIRLPDIAFGAEAWALVELEIPAGLAVENAGQLLQAAVTASTPEGEPLAFADATADAAGDAGIGLGNRAQRSAGGHPPGRTGCRPSCSNRPAPLPNMATGTRSSACWPRPASALPTSPG